MILVALFALAVLLGILAGAGWCLWTLFSRSAFGRWLAAYCRGRTLWGEPLGDMIGLGALLLFLAVLGVALLVACWGNHA